MAGLQPISAVDYVVKHVFDTLTTDPQIISLFNGSPVKLYTNMGLRQDSMPYINYSIRCRGDDEIQFLNYGKLYFSVYDFNTVFIRCQNIANRIKCLLSWRGIPSVPGVLDAARVFQMYSYEQMPTDSERIQRWDLSMPFRFIDTLSLNEKLSRSFPNEII